MTKKYVSMGIRTKKRNIKQKLLDYIKKHILHFNIGMAILVILLVVVLISPIFMKPTEGLRDYIEEYLSEYTSLVNENYALLVSYLSNFTFFMHPPNKIEGIISRTHGAAVFFDYSEIKTTEITIIEISEPIEYYIWPQMPKNTSGLKWIWVKAGDYHLDSPIIYDYGLIYLEPGANLRYTGTGEGIRITGYGAIRIFGSVIYEDRMILKGTNSKEDWSKIQARFDALSDFIWDCQGSLDATKIEELNENYKFFLLLDRIAFRIKNGNYRDNPSLFRADYGELEKAGASNETLSEVLNDYLEMQENPPPTPLEHFWNTYMVHLVPPIIVGLVVLIIGIYYEIHISRTKTPTLRKR